MPIMQISYINKANKSIKRTSPKPKYDIIVKLFNLGEYEAALEAFRALEGFKDSLEQTEKCKTAILD